MKDSKPKYLYCDSPSHAADSGRIGLSDFMPVDRLAGGYIEDPPVTRRAISRLVEGLSGEVTVEVNFRPTFNYARAKTEIEPIL